MDRRQALAAQQTNRSGREYLSIDQDLCWRCGNPGHTHLNCTGDRTLPFCSQCVLESHPVEGVKKSVVSKASSTHQRKLLEAQVKADEELARIMTIQLDMERKLVENRLALEKAKLVEEAEENIIEVYMKIAQQHEARIKNSRNPSDQLRYVDAPPPEKKAWIEKNVWTNQQSGPRVNSRIPQADYGGSRDDSRRPPEQARSHEIQATEGSPKLPLS
ncbi:hypothetical protein JTB14_016564 [Gonioctena quinquepunctata]|nr:hypothetical protein JTB14_016564 [Gonioctena quinquepunctata]